MEDIQIIREFKTKVQVFQPDAEIYFYGSRVRKSHREDSDYDVLVLLNEVNPVVRKKVYDAAWETGFKYDVLVAPVLSLKGEFYSATGSPFFNNVKHQGMVI